MIAILADDLTGAMDTAVQFRKKGFDTQVAVSPARLSPGLAAAQVIAVNTDSRKETGDRAAELTKNAVNALTVTDDDIVYKKVDSLMRGNPVQELCAVMESTGRKTAIAAVSFPAMGRTVRDAVLHLPDGWEKNLKDMFEDSMIPVEYVTLDRVRGDLTCLKAKIRANEKRSIFLFDAETEADLTRIAQLGKGLDSMVFCGSAGLADCLDCRPTRPAARPWPKAGNILVVTGSRKQITARQLKRLEEKAGYKLLLADVERIKRPETIGAELERVVAEAAALLLKRERVAVSFQTLFTETTDFGDQTPEERQYGAYLADRLAEIIKGLPPKSYDGMIIIGGDTAKSVCECMGIHALTLLGEIESGTPLGVFLDGALAGMPVATKSGAFGNDDTLVQAIKMMGEYE